MMGNDLRNMDDGILEILSNEEAIAVNQDPAVIPARRIRKSEPTELWARELSAEAHCVALLNKTEAPLTLEFTWEEIGLAPDQAFELRDIWAKESLRQHTGAFSVEVAPHGVAMIKLSPKRMPQ
jgi:alpha-galactosidase